MAVIVQQGEVLDYIDGVTQRGRHPRSRCGRRLRSLWCGQLNRYMAACPNAAYGMWTNSVERFCYGRVDAEGKVRFDEIPDIPSRGSSEDEAERPRFDQLKPASSDLPHGLPVERRRLRLQREARPRGDDFCAVRAVAAAARLLNILFWCRLGASGTLTPFGAALGRWVGSHLGQTGQPDSRRESGRGAAAVACG